MEHIESLPRKFFLDATLVGNVLVVNDVPSQGNRRVTVALESETQVGVFIRPLDTNLPAFSSQVFDLSDFGSVLVEPHSGSDVIRISVDLPATVNGGNGGDRISIFVGPATVN